MNTETPLPLMGASCFVGNGVQKDRKKCSFCSAPALLALQFQPNLRHKFPLSVLLLAQIRHPTLETCLPVNHFY